MAIYGYGNFKNAYAYQYKTRKIKSEFVSRGFPALDDFFKNSQFGSPDLSTDKIPGEELNFGVRLDLPANLHLVEPGPVGVPQDPSFQPLREIQIYDVEK